MQDTKKMQVQTPGSGRSPGVGNGNSLQYSCLKNSMDKWVWWATVHGVAKESDMTEHTHIKKTHWELCKSICLQSERKKCGCNSIRTSVRTVSHRQICFWVISLFLVNHDAFDSLLWREQISKGKISSLLLFYVYYHRKEELREFYTDQIIQIYHSKKK